MFPAHLPNELNKLKVANRLSGLGSDQQALQKVGHVLGGQTENGAPRGLGDSRGEIIANTKHYSGDNRGQALHDSLGAAVGSKVLAATYKPAAFGSVKHPDGSQTTVTKLTSEHGAPMFRRMVTLGGKTVGVDHVPEEHFQRWVSGVEQPHRDALSVHTK
jgi:hypothetical protein